MLIRIQHYLAPPIFEDEDKTRRARLIPKTLALALVAAPIGIAISWLDGNTPPAMFAAYAAYLVIIIVAGLLINHRAAVRMAALASLVILGIELAENAGWLPSSRVPPFGMERR
jgi:hypothetical protein